MPVTHERPSGRLAGAISINWLNQILRRLMRRECRGPIIVVLPAWEWMRCRANISAAPIPKLQSRAHEQPRQARRGAKPGGPRGHAFVLTGENRFKRCDLRPVSLDLLAKVLQVLRCPGIGMETNSPDTGRRGPEFKELLRNPEHTARTNEWLEEITITDDTNPKLRQERDRHSIKGIARCDPDLRTDSFLLKNCCNG